MALKDIPGRVFLDTCVVNFILDHSEEIHEGIAPRTDAGERVIADITALYNIFFVGQRAMCSSPYRRIRIRRSLPLKTRIADTN